MSLKKKKLHLPTGQRASRQVAGTRVDQVCVHLCVCVFAYLYLVVYVGRRLM